MYLWQSLLVYFGSLFYMSTNPWPTSLVPDGIAWCCCMLWCAGLIQFALSLEQIFDFQLTKALHTIAEYPPCFTVGVIQRSCSFVTNSSLHIDRTIWPKDFELWFVSIKDIIPQLYYPASVPWPKEPFNIVLLLQQCFLDCNSAI